MTVLTAVTIIVSVAIVSAAAVLAIALAAMVRRRDDDRPIWRGPRR